LDLLWDCHALGALLLAVVFLITAVAVVIVVCVKLSRKKEKISACEVQYEVAGPPQLSQGPDPIITHVNVAY